MAVPATTEHLSRATDHATHPVSTNFEEVPSGLRVNGLATQHNAIDALPASSISVSDKRFDNSETVENPSIHNHNDESTSIDPVAPITDVTSGIEPTGDFLDGISTPTMDNPARAQDEVPVTNSEGASSGQEGVSVNGVGPGGDQSLSNGSVSESLQNPLDLPSEVNESEVITTAVSPRPRVAQSSTPLTTSSAIADEVMVDALPVLPKIPRLREDDEDAEPHAKRARTEDRTSVVPDVNGTVAKEHVSRDSFASDGLENALDAGATPLVTATPTQTSPTTVTPSTARPPAPAENGVSHENSQPSVNFGPMTDAQTRLCLEGLKNIRKSRLAASFQKPVDVVALKIPTYLDIIKQPMDLSTMEQKLKAHRYASVNDYVSDFDVMVQNSITFNGPTHIVSLNATGLRAQLNAQLKRMPRSGQNVTVEPPKKVRKTSVSIPRDPKPRASRPLAAPSQPPAVSTEGSFALDADGMPQIRRHSSMTDGRPKREIHKPPPKDLPYSAKPKKKKFQQELKFCLEVLDEITRPAYANSIAGPFMQPVDPVALNIPNYRSLIKKPMDFSTVREKLQTGNYENAKEFEADVKLIFNNCYKFNGKEHFISKMAAELEVIFDQQMQRKSDWLSKHAPPSAPQSPEVDSDVEEEEDEEEDDEEAERQAQLSAIHAQFAQLSGQLLALQSQPPKRAKSIGKKTPKPAKAGTTQARRKSSMSGTATLPLRSEKKSKAKPKAVKPVTTVQKEEISEKIGQLTAEQMGRAAEIIKTSLRKAGRADLADRGDDEMEFEIDQIPDEALHELLKLVRKWVPSTNKTEDHDYRPAANTGKTNTAANQGKARKNKPMKGSEQDLQINRIKAQLNTFQDGGADGVKEEGGDDADSSDDDSDSGSESEEE